MSLHKGPNIIKYCVITSTAALALIAVNTILISQKTTKNADNIKMEIKNISSNLGSLKNEIKNISIDLVPAKRHSQRWNKCFWNKAIWINKKEKNIAELAKETKESVSIAVRNGAVY